MRFFLFRGKWLIRLGIRCLLLLAALAAVYAVYCRSTDAVRVVMGGRLYMETVSCESDAGHEKRVYYEKYFRPSRLPTLNIREIKTDFLWKYNDQAPGKLAAPAYMRKTPEDTLLNYFAILKHAENLKEGSTGGCGTVGDEKLPYPAAYGFLTADYQKRLPYKKYLESFEGIGQINLIKLEGVPRDRENTELLRYFIELETIEGSAKGLPILHIITGMY
ncbi:MAG TPA: hypothetical protein VD757_02500 [Candidatus Nitrosocosmicus sp.]|nr:hypothetical protein [Candidatus Nitrosocosmicus sp.]